MSTHQSLAHMDLNAANWMEAGADQIAAEVKAISDIVASLIKGRAWQGPDAFSFGLRWERELGELARTSASLRLCANNLRSDAQRRLSEIAMVTSNPYLPQAESVA